MPSKNEPSSFFLNFVGEYVQIITNVSFNGSGQSRGTEEAIIPLIIEGYVVDADEQYTYLSPQPVDDIKQAIKNNFIVYIQVMEEADEATQILDSLPSNIRKRDMN